MTGGLSFSGVSLAEALEAEAVFVAAVAILCGVDEEAVTVTISAAARRLLTRRCSRGAPGAPMRRKSDYAPTPKPTTSPPTAAADDEPAAVPTRGATRRRRRRRLRGQVPSLSEAEAVSSTISSTTVADVDAAVATAVAPANETAAVTATAVGAVDFAATRTRAPTAVPLPGDDASSSGSSGGVDAATLGGAAAGGAVLLLAVVAYVVYRRRTVVAEEEEERSPRNSPRIDVEEGVDLKAVKAPRRGRSSPRRRPTSRRRRPRVCDIASCFRVVKSCIL